VTPAPLLVATSLVVGGGPAPTPVVTPASVVTAARPLEPRGEVIPISPAPPVYYAPPVFAPIRGRGFCPS